VSLPPSGPGAFRLLARLLRKGGEMSWVLETDAAMYRGLEALGVRVVDRYRLYEKSLLLRIPE
jgi:hypothetical protein